MKSVTINMQYEVSTSCFEKVPSQVLRIDEFENWFMIVCMFGQFMFLGVDKCFLVKNAF